VTSDSWLKLSINFACLPRKTGKARALEIDLRRVEANLSTGEEEKLSNKYMQKEILHTNRKSCTMIHSRIKWLHTEEDTTAKQKTIRSQNTISEKDCRDLTKINRQRKHEGFDRSLPKVKLCRNRPKGQCCSLPKKRTREAVLQSRLSKGQTRAGRGSVLWKGLRRRSSKGQPGVGRGRVFGRVCEEGCWRVRCEQKIRGAC